MKITARTNDLPSWMLRDKVFRVISAQYIAGIGVQLEFEEVADTVDTKALVDELYEAQELKSQSTIQRDTLPLWES